MDYELFGSYCKQETDPQEINPHNFAKSEDLFPHLFQIGLNLEGSPPDETEITLYL